MRSSQAETDFPIADTIEGENHSMVGGCIENANGCNLPTQNFIIDC
jgi:hypothetical protein